MTDDAYARAGVSQGGADAAVAALVSSLRASAPTESRQVLASGHYAATSSVSTSGPESP